MPSADRIVAATARLDPESRALIELSARRRMSPDEIAGLLDVVPAEVHRRHQEALGRLATELGERHTRRDELRDQLARIDEATWRGEKPPRRRAAEARGRRLLAIGLVLVAIAAAAVVAVVVATGDENEGGAKQSRAGTNATTPTSKKKSRPTASTPAREMERLNGTYGHGTAQLLSGGRLRLRVSGFLQPQGGGYAVWLANSPADSRRLFSTTDTTIERDFRLPSDYRRYRYVEVARAIPELTSPHSDLTLLRVPLSELSG